MYVFDGQCGTVKRFVLGGSDFTGCIDQQGRTRFPPSRTA
jgi:hypothetical protein